MKRPTAASLKKVSIENLQALGAERLAGILVAVADGRPELKRRLRMELAGEQGAEHLATEVDRRLASLETSRSKVSWRQRPTFVRDLDGLRVMIAQRLTALDRQVALDRMWRFVGVARQLNRRLRDRDGELAAVFGRAAADIGGLLAGEGQATRAAEALVDALIVNPKAWAEWLPSVLASAQRQLAQAALRQLSERPGATAGWVPLIRLLADGAGDVEAFGATYPGDARRQPAVAAELGRRMLDAGRVEEARQALEAAERRGEPDFAWETAWIDYLEASGRPDAAQTARWSSFERTLSVERARAFTQRLADFEDVEAEARAIEYAAGHADFPRGLQFLMAWPALADAARMIEARAEDVRTSPEQAELWASKLRVRQPQAATMLLRKAAAEAFRRRDFANCDRLTQEADALGL